MQTATLCGSLKTNETIPFVIYLLKFMNESYNQSFSSLFSVTNVGFNFARYSMFKDVTSTAGLCVCVCVCVCVYIPVRIFLEN
jgi:hypothetical protein